MADAKVQIVGGSFQNAQGAVLNSGYLIFELNQDSKFDAGQVCAGTKIKVSLNSSGNVPTSPAVYIWPNDIIQPANSYYIVSGYTSSGQLAWGPNNQQVLSSPSPFNLNAWIPNKLTNWSPALTALVLKTNDVKNVDQELLNLKSGDNITLADDEAGGITITSTSTALKTNGTLNGSQLILNLKQGTNVTLADDGAGGVTINAPTEAQPYDMGIPVVGVPVVGVSIRYTFPRAVSFPANLVGSYASVKTVATGSTVFTIKKNSVSVGTVTFAIGSASGVFSTSGLALSFAAGDLFELTVPGIADATWADGDFTFVGTR